MTPDQVEGLFDAGESFVEGTIGAALVVLWVLALALHLGRPYMVRTTAKFTLRLGADLWWIIYVAIRDLVVVQVFLGSFIFFYPDVVTGQDLPITGGLAAACRLRRPDDQAGHSRRRRRPGLPLAGAPARAGRLALPRPVLPRQPGDPAPRAADRHDHAVARELQNPDLALPLCYLSAALVGRPRVRRGGLQPPGDRTRRGRPTAAAGREPTDAPRSTPQRRRPGDRPVQRRGGLARPVRGGRPADPVVVHPGDAFRPAVHPAVPPDADAPLRRRRLVAARTSSSATASS